jgi:YbbR domain-containing protein
MKNVNAAEGRWYERLPAALNASTVFRFLLSLAIATFLWGWVTQLTDPVITRVYREMDIAVVSLGDSMMMVTTLPTSQIRVQGPESEFSQLNRADLSVYLDTSTVDGPGEYRLPVLVRSPDTSAVITVEPSHVNVQIDELVAEVMPVEVQNATPAEDPRTVRQIVPEVTQVTVSGPSSAVSRVDRVTLPVTLDNRSSSFTEIFTPYAVDRNGQRVSEVEVLPAQISTMIEIESRGKQVSVIPVVTGVPAEGHSMQQRAVFPDTVVVDGPPEALDSLLFVNTEPVDVTGATSSISEVVGLADLPPGVTVLEPSDGQVEVRVAMDDVSISEQTLTGLPVLAVNVPSGYSATVEPRTISISVDGSSATLAEMESSDIRVVVDVSGLEPGTHEIEPQITLPRGVTWTSSTPEAIEVEITRTSGESTPVAQEPPEALPPDAGLRTRTTGRTPS